MLIRATYFFQAAEMAAKQGGGMENPSAETADPDAAPPLSAVIAPSSVEHKGSPAGASAVVRHKELAPSAVDTGKDTQCLVEEDDSEC